MSSEEEDVAPAPVTSVDELEGWRVNELKDWLQKRGHPRSGKKAVLVKRVYR